MATREEVRNAVRRRLEDTGGSPLWDDLVLNEAVAAAMLRYGLRVPRELSATVAVAAGATSVPLPVGLDPSRIVRVLDERGEPVSRARTVPDPLLMTTVIPVANLAQAWRVWDGTLQLERPATGGNWRLEYLGPRAVAPDDLATLDLLPGDEEAVVELTVALVLRQRLAADAKRGIAANPALTRLITSAEATAAALLDRRQRRAIGGWLS